MCASRAEPSRAHAPAPLADADSATDPVLVALIREVGQIQQQMAEQLQQGQNPDVGAIGREHPDLSDELRELWATVQIANEMARTDPSDFTVQYPERTGSAPERLLGPTRSLANIGDCELLEALMTKM